MWIPSVLVEIAKEERPIPHSISDIKVASIAMGFTLGFGFLTTWEAIKQTSRARSPVRSAYIWMIWGETMANTGIAIMAYMALSGVAKLNLPFLLIILSFWVLEVQLLMQIIINRLAIVLSDRRFVSRLKWGTAALVTCINISVYLIWVPARLEVNQTYVKLNDVWDRVEKVLLLIIDAALNWYFVRVVKQRLVENGLKKYDKLVRFNVRIILVSISMDILIIALMSLKNGAVYMQLHPLAYTVKLNIEMSMANLITKIARDKSDVELSSSAPGFGSSGITRSKVATDPKLTITTRQDIIVETQSIDEAHSFGSTHQINGRSGDYNPDDKPPVHDGPWGSKRTNIASVQAHHDNSEDSV